MEKICTFGTVGAEESVGDELAVICIVDVGIVGVEDFLIVCYGIVNSNAGAAVFLSEGCEVGECVNRAADDVNTDYLIISGGECLLVLFGIETAVFNLEAEISPAFACRFRSSLVAVGIVIDVLLISSYGEIVLRNKVGDGDGALLTLEKCFSACLIYAGVVKVAACGTEIGILVGIEYAVGNVTCRGNLAGADSVCDSGSVKCERKTFTDVCILKKIVCLVLSLLP